MQVTVDAITTINNTVVMVGDVFLRTIVFRNVYCLFRKMHFPESILAKLRPCFDPSTL